MTLLQDWTSLLKDIYIYWYSNELIYFLNLCLFCLLFHSAQFILPFVPSLCKIGSFLCNKSLSEEVISQQIDNVVKEVWLQLKGRNVLDSFNPILPEERKGDWFSKTCSFNNSEILLRVSTEILNYPIIYTIQVFTNIFTLSVSQFCIFFTSYTFLAEINRGAAVKKHRNNHLSPDSRLCFNVKFPIIALVVLSPKNITCDTWSRLMKKLGMKMIELRSTDEEGKTKAPT